MKVSLKETNYCSMSVVVVMHVLQIEEFGLFQMDKMAVGLFQNLPLMASSYHHSPSVVPTTVVLIRVYLATKKSYQSGCIRSKLRLHYMTYLVF
jgi:hypothetical protein